MSKLRLWARDILREAALDVLGLGTKPSNGIHLLNGHLLSKDEYLDADYFDNQLKVLSRKSSIIPFVEAVELLNKGKSFDYSLLAFSYDDGFSECYTHIAPVLEKYNGYGCFFICPNFVDGDKAYVDSFLINKVHQQGNKRPMSWAQIKELSDKGHAIGAHTMDHVRLSEIDNNQDLYYQIGKCKSVIETHTLSKCDSFAFTYGHWVRDFNWNMVKIACEYYDNIFSAFKWNKYFCCDGLVLNRRQAEPYWKVIHINYFLSKKIDY